jgi:hypothetical protein
MADLHWLYYTIRRRIARLKSKEPEADDELGEEIGLEAAGEVVAEDAPAPGEAFEVVGGREFKGVGGAEEDVEGGDEEEEAEGVVAAEGRRGDEERGEGEAGVFVEDDGAGVGLAEVGGGPFSVGDEEAGGQEEEADEEAGACGIFEIRDQENQEEDGRGKGAPGAGCGFEESDAAAGDDPFLPGGGGAREGGDALGEGDVGAVTQEIFLTLPDVGIRRR